MKTTVGQLLIQKHIPSDLHHLVDKTLDKRGLNELFSTLAEKYPIQYPTIVANLTRLGFDTSTKLGSSISLKDLISSVDKNIHFNKADKDIAAIKKNLFSKKEEKNKIDEVYNNLTDTLNKEIVHEGLKKNQTLAKVIASGSRGTPSQYRQTVSAAVIVDDRKGNYLTEIPIRSSYAEGLSLPEYLATSFTSRAGSTAGKLAIADSGFLSKQLNRATLPVKVMEHDCGTDRGLEFPVSDRDSIGSYLSKAVKGFNKNNEVTSNMLNELKNKKITSIIVRSPITCESSKRFNSGAVCQMCVGKRDKGISKIGDFVGINATTAISEPVSQLTLGSKHHGKGVGGFKLINQIANPPKNFNQEALVAEEDGKITRVENLPQGGKNIFVNDKSYYAQEGLNSKVSVGQFVEEGDMLSDGIVNPSKIVMHRGIGEGRKEYALQLHDVFKKSGLSVNRRNFELLAKAHVDHVKLDDDFEDSDHLPGQIVSYQSVEKNYQPRVGNKQSRVDQAKGMYLEKPELHYSIGTKVTSRVVNDLLRNGVQSIVVHKESAPFKPFMPRLLDVPDHMDDDWVSQLNTSYLQDKIINAVNRGAVTDVNKSTILGIATGKIK